MSSLPLKLRVGVRDHWDAPDSPVQRSLSRVKEVLGAEVACRPEWMILLAELERVYAGDKGQLAAAVASSVDAWCTALATLLEDEEHNAAWAEELLERCVAGSSRLSLFVETSPGTKPPSTAWSSTRSGFVLYLPKGSPVPGPTALVAIFSGELLSCFEAKGRSSSGADEDDDASAILTPVSSSVVSLPVRSGAGGDSDWADVSMDRSMGQARVVEATPSSSLRHHAAQPGAVAAAASPLAAVAATTPNIPRVEILPAARSLPRPDELLRRPPYHLLVTARAYNEVEVQCSHSGSLVLLADYLRQWCRVNHNDTRNPPVVAVTLHQSPWGLGQLHDTLTLSADNRYGTRYAVSPTVVLHLVEAVLGYSPVGTGGDGGGSTWRYRKDVEFKN